MAHASDEATLQHCKDHATQIITRSPVYGHFLSRARVVLAKPGRVVARMTLERIHLNSKDILHGSVIATLIDFIGGLAIASHDMRGATGVSADMHISFVSTARLGEAVDVEGLAVKVGSALAFTTATVTRVLPVDDQEGEQSGIAGGPVVATGSHTKYLPYRSTLT